MSRIKTLSEDIDVSVSTTNLISPSGASGYVRTKIYENGIGVFSGLSYVTEGTALIVNINDIASQNDYKKDYLKLQTNEELKTDPLINDIIGTHNVKYRFHRGAISTYKVKLDGNNTSNETSIDVLCGYDYVNIDLQPRCAGNLSQFDLDTSLCRLMTGCQWIWKPNQDMGSFTNSLPDEALPHYPFVYTNKYGVGLSLNHPGNDSLSSYCNTEFALRLTIGSEFNLGMTPFVSSNTAFVTLNNFLSFIGNSSVIRSDYNSSIYLKQTGTSSDDAFGDWEEGYTIYRGLVQVPLMCVSTYLKSGNEWLFIEIMSGTYNNGTYGYQTSYNHYINSDWNTENDAPSTWPNYDTYNELGYVWLSADADNETLANFYANSYRNGHGTITKLLSQLGLEMKQEIAPIYNNYIDLELIPDKFIGTCVIGILDRCPARYYLAWNDRYGDIQSQPFDGKIEYTEDIKSEEIVDYKLRRRVSHKSIQPKWKLNTKWLKDGVYPIYESLFTSPYVLLYDTEQDKAWNVIVTDNKYTEKKYKNDKMFNLEINVEAIKTQELTY